LPESFGYCSLRSLLLGHRTATGLIGMQEVQIGCLLRRLVLTAVRLNQGSADDRLHLVLQRSSDSTPTGIGKVSMLSFAA
jgi:hypothetical protein